MNEKIEVFKKNTQEIPEQKNYKRYLNTRIEDLTKEDVNNENMIINLLNIRDEDDYAEEYEEAIEKIFRGDSSIDNKVKKIQDICSRRNFSISHASQAKTEDEKAEIFWGIIYEIMEDEKPAIKAESFKIAVEQQRIYGIRFEGFKKDSDFFGIHSFLKKAFPNGLIDKALISRLTYLPNIVNISIRGKIYFLPMDKYFEWKKKFKELPQYKTRAVNRGSSNRLPITMFHSSPVEIYSFIDEELNNFEYLKNISNNRKMRTYKIGTITHEVGHNLYTNLLGHDEKNAWKRIIDSVGHLTYYSKKYSNNIYGNAINYEEEFAEAIRLITTSNDYLKQKFFNVYDFLIEIFPELKK